MGSKIHKVIGWGLTNVETHKNKINDPRFTDVIQSKGFDPYVGEEIIEWIKKKPNQTKISKLITEANGDEWNKHSKIRYIPYSLLWLSKESKNERTLPPVVIYDPEYGLKNTIVFTSFDDSDIYRFDDLIDYYECENTKPKVKNLSKRCGIFPNLGIVRIPGSQSKNPTLQKTYTPAGYSMLVGNWDPKLKPLASSAEEIEDLKNNYRPVISSTVMVSTYYLKIFKDWKKTIQELRPMLYTYWS